ncbi:hypothetical protein I4U23_015769 [Adineta vaga]|nr:hypothetical protein I4U23_015769 [Adineta vaga]
MSRSPPSRYIIHNGPNGRNVYYTNEIEPEELRVSSLRPRYYDEEYQHHEPRRNDKHQTDQSKSRICCSKLWIIGLIIGLAIGAVIIVAVVVPLAVVKRPLPSFVRGETYSTPTWSGTYQTDSSCDSSVCCCFTNLITLSQTGSSLLQLNGSLSGQCIGSSNLVSYSQTMPTTFFIQFTWYVKTFRVILSRDNSYLGLVDNNVGYCSSTALKTSYGISRMNNINLNLMISMLLIIIEIII